MSRTRRIYRQQGFTLIEMLIGLLLGGIVLAAVVGSFQSQHRSYLAQDYVAEAQQNLRTGMNMMTEEIRMAGYDPEDGAAGATIESMSASGIAFSMDLNGNGTLTVAGVDDGEYITYGLYTDGDGIRKLGRKNTISATNTPVASNVVGLEFRYFDSTGAVTATAANVRSVEITMATRASTIDPSLTGPAETFTTPGGATWTIEAKYRWRATTTRVICRNMGL